MPLLKHSSSGEIRRGYHIQKSQPASAWSLSFDESGLPASYRAEFEANPWLNLSASGGFLGFGKNREQKQINENARKYYADLLSRYHEETYNSPVEAVQRERLAGINPDLVGLDSAGVAGNRPDLSGSVEYSSPVEQLSSVADTLLSIASIATATPSVFAQLRGQKLANDAQSIENAGMMNDLVDSDAGALMPLKDLKDDASFGEILQAAYKSGSRADDLAKVFFPRSKSQQKQFTQSYHSRSNILKNQLSRFANLQQLNAALSSAEVSEPELSKLLTKTYMQYQLESLQNKVECEKRLNQFYKRNSGKLTDLEDKNLDSEVAAADASKSESELSKDIADNTDGKSIGSAQSAEGIVRYYKAKQDEIDLKYIKEFGEEVESMNGLDKAVDFMSSDRETAVKHKVHRRRYKSAHSRIYGRESSSSHAKMSFKGIGFEF